jgi:hypothetical protein
MRLLHLENRAASLSTFEAQVPQRELNLFEHVQRRSGRRMGFVPSGLVSLIALLPAEVPRALHVLAPERLFGPELIVSSAADAKIYRVVTAAEPTGIGVVELEKCPRLALTAVGGDVRALHPIAFEDLPAHGVRNSIGLGSERRKLAGSARRAGRFGGFWVAAFHSAEPLPFELDEQEIDRALDHDAEVAARVRVTHEGPAEVEFFAKDRACCEFDSKASL